jgi:RloB-like protein
MRPIQRKARPLIRDAMTLRDDRLFIVACDDTYAPKQYFDFFRIHRVQVHVVPAVEGRCSAAHVLERLQGIDHEPDDELWMLLDTDHYVESTHIRAFMGTIAEARRQGVNVALSKPCFELWLLLHHADESAVIPLSTARHVEEALRAKLGQYNKTRLRQEHFPLNSVSDAYTRARRLDGGAGGGEIPVNNTSRVYLLWRAILAKALPSQIPAQFEGLR